MIKQKELKQMYIDFLKKKDIKEIINFCLEVQGKNYSPFNYLMAWRQADMRQHKFYGCLKPFPIWKKDNTYINQGEKALMIFRPCFKKILDEKTQEEKDILIGFAQAPVFDISQTNNPELKEYEEKLNKAMYIRFNEGLLNLQDTTEELKNKGLKITINNDSTKINGWFNSESKEITVNNNSINTLIHEFGHYLSFNPSNSYAKNEVMAEIASYIFLRFKGFEFEFNTNYSNNWSTAINEFRMGEFEKQIKTIIENINKLYGHNELKPLEVTA